MVSIIMPVRNEALFIECCLQAIFDQSYPHDLMEIVIGDGQSADTTRELIENSKTKTDIPIILIDNPARIAPAALNRCIAMAKGAIVIRVDGHCQIEKHYVEECVRFLLSANVDGVGGPIETVAQTPQAAAIAVAMSSRFGVGGAPSGPSRIGKWKSIGRLSRL